MNDNELHQQLCQTFHINYLQEMDIILKIKTRIERKINNTLPALLPNSITNNTRGPVTSTGKNMTNDPTNRQKRVIPVLAIAQGMAAIGGMLIKVLLSGTWSELLIHCLN